jgi:hypothetical protein
MLRVSLQLQAERASCEISGDVAISAVIQSHDARTRVAIRTIEYHMTDNQITQAIERALLEQRRSKYWLAKQCGIEPKKIYAILNRDFGVRYASAMLDALKLHITQKGTES